MPRALRVETAFMGYLRIGVEMPRYTGPDPEMNEVIPGAESSDVPGINRDPGESIPVGHQN
jgi:hypothetical protein